MAIKIMIADDHSMIREGLKSLLELEGDIQVVAEAEDGVDCLEKLKICTPDVLLLILICREKMVWKYCRRLNLQSQR